MKNSIFNNDEWDRILENAFSENSEPHQFSKSYQTRKNNMIKEYNMKNNQNSVNKSRKKLMTYLIAAAMIIAIPVSAFAISGYFKPEVLDNSTYSKQLKFDISDCDNTNIKDTIMSLKLNWIPDDMKCFENVNSFEKYHSEIDQNRAISLSFYKIDNTKENLSNDILYSVAQKEFTTADGNNAVIIYKDKGYNQLWVEFANTNYVAQVYVKGLTDDEIYKIADNLCLTPSNKEYAVTIKSTETITIENLNHNSIEFSTIDINNLQYCNVGDTINYDGFDITIQSAELQQNFDGITTNSTGEFADFSKYLNENRTITTERILTQLGDGITTLDKELSRENITQSVLKLNLNIVNKSNAKNEFCVYMSPFHIKDNSILNLNDTGNNKVYSYSKTDDIDNNFFSFYTTHQHTKNNICNFETGDFAQVTLAFIVNNDVNGNLYALIGDSNIALNLCDIFE